MIREAIEYCASLVAKGTAAHVVDECKQRKTLFFDGGLVNVSKEPEELVLRARSLADFVEAVRSIAGTHEMRVAVGVDEVEAAAYDESGHRFARVVFGNRVSRAFKFLDGCDEKANWLNQKSLIRTLRVDFSEANECASLAKRLGRVDFSRSAQTKATYERGKESLGRAVESSVQSVEELPEQVRIALRVWHWGPPVDVVTLLEIDAEGERFALVPMDGAMKSAVDQSVAWLCEKVAESLIAAQVSASVFGGTL